MNAFSISTKVTRQEIQMSEGSDGCKGWLLTRLKYALELKFAIVNWFQITLTRMLYLIKQIICENIFEI